MVRVRVEGQRVRVLICPVEPFRKHVKVKHVINHHDLELMMILISLIFTILIVMRIRNI